MAAVGENEMMWEPSAVDAPKEGSMGGRESPGMREAEGRGICTGAECAKDGVVGEDGCSAEAKGKESRLAKFDARSGLEDCAGGAAVTLMIGLNLEDMMRC